MTMDGLSVPHDDQDGAGSDLDSAKVLQVQMPTGGNVLQTVGGQLIQVKIGLC